MKYTESIEIDLPRKDVVRLISDADSIPKWLRGLKEHEPLSGNHGEVGTSSRIVFDTGSQEMEATETVVRQEPQDLENLQASEIVYYDRELEAEGMWSISKDRFIELEPERTLWESENVYRFDGVMMRVLAPFMKGSFRKQQRVHMEDFKAFAERGVDVREAE